MGVRAARWAVAAAQPQTIPADVHANVAAHAAMVREADARLVVFPELSLTGYVLDAPPISPADPVFAQLIDACGKAGTVALVGAPVAEVGAPAAEVGAPVAEVGAPVAEVGAPVAEVGAPVAEVGAPVAEIGAPAGIPTVDGVARGAEVGPAAGPRAADGVAAVGGAGADDAIAMLLIDGAGARVVYRKVWLGGDEPQRFAAGTEPGVVEVDGWRIGLGICKDTGVAAHVEAVAALAIDLYAAGVTHRPDELHEQERRARRIALATGVPVVLASSAGPTGPGYEATAGCSSIWSAAGDPLARTDDQPGTWARAELVLAPTSPPPG